MDSDLRDGFPSSPARNAVVAVVRAFGAVQRLMTPYFAQFQLTPPQFQLLTIAERMKERGPTQRHLARALYVSFPNVTVMVDRLEKAGLLLRRRHARDKRANFVALTARGRSLLRRIWKVHQAQLDRVMIGLTVREQTELVRLLNKLTAAHATREQVSGSARTETPL